MKRWQYRRVKDWDTDEINKFGRLGFRIEHTSSDHHVLMEREILCREHEDCLEKEDLARECANKRFVEEERKLREELKAKVAKVAVAALPAARGIG